MREQLAFFNQMDLISQWFILEMPMGRHPSKLRSTARKKRQPAYKRSLSLPIGQLSWIDMERRRVINEEDQLSSLTSLLRAKMGKSWAAVGISCHCFNCQLTRFVASKKKTAFLIFSYAQNNSDLAIISKIYIKLSHNFQFAV